MLRAVGLFLCLAVCVGLTLADVREEWKKVFGRGDQW